MTWQAILAGVVIGLCIFALFAGGFLAGRVFTRREATRLLRAKQGLDPWAKRGTGLPKGDRTT